VANVRLLYIFRILNALRIKFETVFCNEGCPRDTVYQDSISITCTALLQRAFYYLTLLGHASDVNYV